MNENEKKKIIWIISAVVAMFMTITIVHNNQEVLAYKRTQESLADQVLRFHVLAHSDSQQDQELKLLIKDAVIEYMKLNLEHEEDVSKTKMWVENHLQEIQDIAIGVIESEGFDYSVDVALSEVEFPTKRYGDISFPSGVYEALRIQIGQAEGENWWCCLYPNLCFIDATYAVVSEEGKEELETVLTEEEYEMITTATEFKFKWFFFR